MHVEWENDSPKFYNYKDILIRKSRLNENVNFDENDWTWEEEEPNNYNDILMNIKYKGFKKVLLVIKKENWDEIEKLLYEIFGVKLSTIPVNNKDDESYFVVLDCYSTRYELSFYNYTKKEEILNKYYKNEIFYL